MEAKEEREKSIRERERGTTRRTGGKVEKEEKAEDVEGEKERKGGLGIYKRKWRERERGRERGEGWFVTRAQERQRRPASGLRSGVEKRARGKATERDREETMNGGVICNGISWQQWRIVWRDGRIVSVDGHYRRTLRFRRNRERPRPVRRRRVNRRRDSARSECMPHA